MNSQFSTGFVIALVIGIAVGALWPKYGPDLTNNDSDRVGNAQQVSFAAGNGRQDGRGCNGGCEQTSKAVVGHGAGHGQSSCGQSTCNGAGESACSGKGQSVGHRNGQSAGHGKGMSAGRGKNASAGRGKNASAGRGKNASAGHGKNASAGHGKNASAGRGNGQGRGLQSGHSAGCSESGCDHPAEASTSESLTSEHGKQDCANDHSLAKHDGPGLGLGLGLGMGRGWGRGFEHTEAETADDDVQETERN